MDASRTLYERSHIFEWFAPAPGVVVRVEATTMPTEEQSPILSATSDAVAAAVGVLTELARALEARLVIVGADDLDEGALRRGVALLEDEFGTVLALGHGSGGVDGAEDLVVAGRDGGRQLAEVLRRIVGDDGDVRAGGDEDLARRVRSPRPVAARSAGADALSVLAPARFAELVEEYRGALLALLQQRAYRITSDARDRVVRLAEDLAGLHADPRDVIALHAEVMRGLASQQPEALLVAAREESTMLLVEVLGYLARSYRQKGGGSPTRAA